MKAQGNLSPWLMSLFEISSGWFGHPKTGSSTQNSYHKVWALAGMLWGYCYHLEKQSLQGFLVLCVSPRCLGQAPAVETSREPRLPIMAGVFPLLWGCVEPAAVRQGEHPSPCLGCGMPCCSCTEGTERLSSYSRCEEWGGQPQAQFWGSAGTPRTQLNKDKHWHRLVSSWSPRRRGFLFPKLWCAHRFFMWIFCFQVSSFFSFFFNTIEFSKCKIIFWFSRQICCCLSRLSDIAGAFNKCLLLLMEIKLLGVSLARGIKN